jgi:hypothetical protein
MWLEARRLYEQEVTIMANAEEAEGSAEMPITLDILTAHPG